MMSVYVSVNSGTVAVAWYAPVSHVTACVEPLLLGIVWLSAMVYVAWFAEHEARISTALGVMESEV